MILATLIAGTLRRHEIWKRLNRLAVIFFVIFVLLFPNVMRWPEQIARRLPGGRQALLEPTHPYFKDTLNQSFHDWYLAKNGKSFEAETDFKVKMLEVDYYIRRVKMEYVYDLMNPLYLLDDHLPTVSEILASDTDGDGKWEDDCDGMTILTASFLIFLGYNAFISEVEFHWQTIVFPWNVDPRTVEGYLSGVALYMSSPDELVSFYLFNQTEMFIPPTRTIWHGVWDNIAGTYLLGSLFEAIPGEYLWVLWIIVPVAAYLLCILFATLLRIFNWKLQPGTRIFKESGKTAIILSAVLYLLVVLFLTGLLWLGNIVLFGGIAVTLAYLDPRLHGRGDKKERERNANIDNHAH